MKKNSEYLSKDILDSQFIKPFKPMYQFQLLMASSRVNIKDSFVTSPSYAQKFHSIVTVIGILVFDFIIIQYYNLLNAVENITFNYLCVSVIILQTLAFLCNVIHVRFVNGKENAAFFVKLQQIDRLMKLDSNKTITAIMFHSTVLSITWVLALCCAIIGTGFLNTDYSMWSLIGIMYSQINVIIEIAACSNIFMFFYVRTQFVNGIMYNYIHYEDGKVPLTCNKTMLSTLCPTKMFMRALATETHNFPSSETDVYLKEILHGFSLNQQLCKFQIFLFCCKLVAACILSFQYILLVAQNEKLFVMDSLTPTLFTVIDIIAALILVVRCESFLREVKGTKHLAITIMSLQVDGQLREKAKRMLKLIEETPPRLSVYEMWDLNARVLLQIFTLVSSLILAQLQFEFL